MDDAVTAKLKAATQRLRNRISRMGASRIARSEMTDAVMTMVAVEATATSRTPLWLASGLEFRGRRLSRRRAYAPTADALSAGCFPGAGAINAAPMISAFHPQERVWSCKTAGE